MEGGYQIIDLKDIPLTEAGVVIPRDLYGLVANTRKPLLIQNISIKGDDEAITKYNDIFATARRIGMNYTVSDFSQKITIIFTPVDGYVQGVDSINIDPVYISINDTLEIDENGDLGVASE